MPLTSLPMGIVMGYRHGDAPDWTLAQARIQNLPFSGSTLFGSNADDEMGRMKAELDTLKAVGLEKEYRRYKPYDRRGFHQRVQTPQWGQKSQQR